MEDMEKFTQLKGIADSLSRGEKCEFIRSFGDTIIGTVTGVNKIDNYQTVVGVLTKDGIGGVWVSPRFIIGPGNRVTDIRRIS